MLASPVSEREALIASFCEVAEQSFFAFAEAADGTPEPPQPVAEWLSALVRFSGPVDGSMRVTMPAELGVELCAAFLGAGPDDELLPSAVEDLVGEFANMACGAWLTAVRRADAFALSHPEVSRVAAADAGGAFWMLCNGQPVALAIAEAER